MPSILPAGQGGDIVLRGSNFRPTTAVSIGGVPASAVTYVSNTELRASFAARPAGIYPVMLDSGSTAFNGQLTLVNVPTYTTASVPYPDPNAAVFWLAHDPWRQSLAVLYFPLINNAPLQLVRYAYQAGSWVQTQSLAPPVGIVQMAMAPDASKLMVLTARNSDINGSQNAMLELDPVTLQTTKATPLSLANSNALSFGFVNDGNALITTRAPGSGGQNFTYLFALNSGQLLQTDHANDLEVAAASGDGSVAFSGLYQYNASTGRLVLGGGVGGWGCFTTCTVNETMPSTLSRNGNRMLAGTSVTGRDGQLLGRIDANGHLAGVINPQGTRAYTLDTSYLIHTFDLTSALVNGNYVELGAPIPVTAGTPLGYSQTRMTISLDGKTAFIATYYGLRIVPLP